ncbi:MAG: DNA polymerase III subunit delta [Candidatus Dojkabacteria bacterium]|nr:DNA polymerase III subunit delta [Candidatus Dojkabacteria bacterium]
MLYLIGGENIYESQRRLEELKEDFVARSGGIVNTYNADEMTDPNEIAANVDSLSLFNQEKLIIVKRLLSSRSQFADKVVDLLKVSKRCNCIFWEDKAFDKRKVFYKVIKRIGNVEEFSKLSYTQLKTWVTRYLRKRIDFDPICVERLILKLGNDQMQLANMIDNLVFLACSKGAKKLEEGEVLDFVQKTAEENVWDLVDSLGSYDKSRALAILEDIIKDTGDFVKIIGMLTRQLRILVMTKYLIQVGRSQSEIVRKLRLHPFVVKKSISHSSNFTFAKLRKLYQKLLNTDLVVKEGRFEERLVLDLFVAAL